VLNLEGGDFGTGRRGSDLFRLKKAAVSTKGRGGFNGSGQGQWGGGGGRGTRSGSTRKLRVVACITKALQLEKREGTEGEIGERHLQD